MVQSDYAWPCLFFAALALLAIAADRIRSRRQDLGRSRARVAWMPWPLITILSLIAAAIFAALWIGDR